MGVDELVQAYYRGYCIVEAQKMEAHSPQSVRGMYWESQHYLPLIRFPTFWGLLYKNPTSKSPKTQDQTLKPLRYNKSTFDQEEERE